MLVTAWLRFKNEMHDINKQLKAMLDTAQDEKRDLNKSEMREYNELDKKFDELASKVKNNHVNDARLRAEENDLQEQHRSGADVSQELYLVQKEMRLRGLQGPPLPDVNVNVGNIEQRSNDKMKNRMDPETRAFCDVMLRGEKSPEYRDLMVADDGAGGFLVLPETLSGDIIHDLDNEVFLRRYARKFPISRAAAQGIPVMDTDISDPDFKAEIAEADLDTDMNFEKRKLYPHRLTKGIKYSKDLRDIGLVNATEFILSRLRYKRAVTEENKFLNGTGVSEPLGLFTDSEHGISHTDRGVSTGNTSGAVKYDGLVNAMYNLKAQYLRDPSCHWIFHRDLIKMIRKLKDGEGNPLWQPGMQAGQPATIMGIPVIMSEYAPNTLTSTYAVGLIGALRFYGIAEFDTMEIQILSEKYALTNQDAALLRCHVDGMPLIQNAFSIVLLG